MMPAKDTLVDGGQRGGGGGGGCNLLLHNNMQNLLDNVLIIHERISHVCIPLNGPLSLYYNPPPPPFSLNLYLPLLYVKFMSVQTEGRGSKVCNSWHNDMPIYLITDISSPNHFVIVWGLQQIVTRLTSHIKISCTCFRT